MYYIFTSGQCVMTYLQDALTYRNEMHVLGLTFVRPHIQMHMCLKAAGACLQANMRSLDERLVSHA